MTRSEHLQWAKKRAFEYLDNGDLNGALSSFTSDMQKHEELKSNPAFLLLMPSGFIHVQAGNIEGLRNWIDGFN